MNSNSGKTVLWDTGSPHSQFAGFPNEVLIPGTNNSTLNLLVCCAVSRMSLDSITIPLLGVYHQKHIHVFIENMFKKVHSASVQSSSVAQLCPTLCDPMYYSRPDFPVHHSAPGVYSNSCPLMPSNHLILCHPLFLLPSIFPDIRVFSNESVLCIRQPKYWSFSFSISPSNEYSGLISFSIDRLDLL